MSQLIQTLNEIKGQSITLDFNKNNYISVTVKQHDENSRNIFIKVANSGQILTLDPNLKVEIKMKTPDERDILDDSCVSITDNGIVLFNPSDDMLAKSGKALTELRIYDLETEGRISLMNFYVVIVASPYDEDRILNSQEFKSLVNLYKQAIVDYEYVIAESQTYANLASESEQNAAKSAFSADEDATTATEKAESALQSASIATTKADESSVSASNALISEQNAKVSENNSKASESVSKLSETNARESELNAKESEEIATEQATIATESANKASASEINAEIYMNTAIEKADETKASEVIAITKANEASTSATNAALSETNAKDSETVATTMANLSKSYAVGTDGIVRSNDATHNSKYFCELAERHANAATGIVYRGTRPFTALSLEENQKTNYLFNISEKFVSDDTFEDGAGIKYPAGTNVCRTEQGTWDVFTGIESFGTGEIVTESIYDEPTDQSKGEYWIFTY